MTRYLLDTSTLVDFSKGWEPSASQLLALIDGGDEVAVCAINVAEFYTGIPPEERPHWRRFLAALPHWVITREAAERAGSCRYDLARQGQALSLADALLAAVAQEYGATLITENTKDFPLPGIRLLSLRNS
ncbi:MAG: hypothetical protein CL878_15705 [Dehalococcoidia bacterium]|nr:hypothetical protein [Dehalococcoidia bacterium]